MQRYYNIWEVYILEGASVNLNGDNEGTWGTKVQGTRDIQCLGMTSEGLEGSEEWVGVSVMGRTEAK